MHTRVFLSVCRHSLSTSLSLLPTSPSRSLALAVAALAVLGSPALAGPPQVDSFYGAFGTDIDIEVPKFRALEPSIKLSYSSTGSNGLVGVGWTLQAGSTIQRASPGGGVPRYDASDIYLLDGQELVSCTALGGTHCTKIQNYQRIQWDSANNRWIVTQKNGTNAIYNAQITTGLGTFRWALASQTDTHSNVTNYNYACDGYDCYLDTITYNGNTIRFYREARSDVVQYGRGAGSLGRMSNRLRSIDVLVGANRARIYRLSYAQSSTTSRSLLTSVQQYGRDAVIDGTGAVTSGTTLPASTYGYSGGTITFQYSSDGPAYSDASGWGAQEHYSTIRFPDVNGDGKADMCARHSGGIQCYLGTGSGFTYGFEGPRWASASGWGAAQYNSTIQYPDLNGDGKADICGRHSGGIQCYLSTGTSFVYAFDGPAYSDASGWGAQEHYSTIRFPDINGDGKADMCARHSGGIQCYYGTGSGFVYGFEGPRWTSASGWGAAQYNSTIQYPDLNGDGKADICGRHSGGIQCYLSTGTSFVYSFDGPAYSDASGWGAQEHYSTIRFPDINGDGRADMCARHSGGIQCYYGTGNGFVYGFEGPAWASASGWGAVQYNSTIQYPDINGDGMADVCARHSGGLQCYRSTGTGFTYGFDGPAYADASGWGAVQYYSTIQTPDVDGDGKADMCARHSGGIQCYKGPQTGIELMATAQNGIGGVTRVSYKPSTAWINTFLPQGAIFQTASSITLEDGRGQGSTTNYTYEGGLWSSAERRFLGFRRVKAVLDAAGNYTETYYHQHVGCIAKPETTYYRDAAGNLFSYSSYGYSESASAPYTSLLTSRWDYECNQTASCRRILTQLGYDSYGNATTTYEYGDYDVSGDERTTLRGYVPNTTAYIAASPAYENVYSGIGTTTLVGQTLYEYDSNTSYSQAPTIGDLRRKKGWNSQTGGYSTTTYLFDVWGNLINETDARGYTKGTDYDPYYHLYATNKCDALGQCSTQTWDYVLGQATAVTDANGLTSSYTYDVLGRPVRKTAPDGGYVEYSYLDWGSATSQRTRTTIWDGTADGLWKETYQDGLGREVLVVEENTFRKETLYSDASARVWKESLRYQIGETPRYRTYSYDGAGRVRTVSNPDGTVAQRVYGNGYEAIYDELNRERVNYKDAYGRIKQVRERNGGVYQYTSYIFDALGRMTSLVDAAGNQSTFTFDSLGRKLSACDVDLGCWSYTFDAAGNLLSQRDAKGQTVTFTYDALGRMKTKTVPSGQVSTWSYDEAGHGAGKGKLTSMSDPSGTESVSYDFAGRITQTTKCISGSCATMAYSFDKTGRASTITYQDGEQVSYTYDIYGRVYSISNYATAILYNSAGQVSSLTYANGTRTSYTYDPNRTWLQSAQVTNAGGGVLYQAGYTYDAAARVTAMSSTTNPLSNLSLGYDDLNRLTAVGGGQVQSFGYDAVGNLTYHSALGSLSYGDTTHRHAVTLGGGQSYSYDLNGNLVSGGGRSITWDADNRPASITKGGQTASFLYDATGARVQKTGPSGTTRYFGSVLEQRPDNTFIKYIYAGPLLIARNESSGRSFYHQDHLGSVRLITDAAGSVVRRYDYSPMGSEVSSSGTLANSRGYSGHVSDPETGLLFMNARYYDPAIGRFLSPDWLVPDALNPQALNRYSYVYNNPISNIDPTGHAPVVAAVFVVGSAFASGSAVAITVALVGAATTVAGYALKNPVLVSIGSVLLGFSGGFVGGAGFLAGPGLAGGLVSATVAAVTSPISPLDPSVKQAIGWAFTAQSLIKGFTARSQSQSDPSGGKIQEPEGFSTIERRVQADASQYGTGLSDDIQARVFSSKEWASDLEKSLRSGYFGSRTHVLYGELVERLTGGNVSALDALVLNPCGGLVGPGCGTLSQLLSGVFRSGPVYQHALLHDALGFLRVNGGIGPGYTYVGFSFLSSTSPLGGQLSGIFWHIPYQGWVPGVSVGATLLPWPLRNR